MPTEIQKPYPEDDRSSHRVVTQHQPSHQLPLMSGGTRTEQSELHLSRELEQCSSPPAGNTPLVPARHAAQEEKRGAAEGGRRVYRDRPTSSRGQSKASPANAFDALSEGLPVGHGAAGLVGLTRIADRGVEGGEFLGLVLGFVEVADGAEAVGVAVAGFGEEDVGGAQVFLQTLNTGRARDRNGICTGMRRGVAGLG